jgi:uncharacterized membrane protein YfcA
MAGYAVAGLWTPVVTRYFLVALPASAVAIALGRIVNRRMATQQFFRYIYIGLIVVGLILLAQATRDAL